MKTFTKLVLISILLISCEDNQATIKTSDTNAEVADSSSQKEINKEPTEETTTIEVQFVEFSFDDSEHYIFKDDQGKIWDFSSCNSEVYKFSRLLPENESNEENQGWGSNEHLIGKWFKIEYYKTIRQLYIDGPEGEVEIIHSATLIADKQVNLTGDFKLKIKEFKEDKHSFSHTGITSPNGSTKLLLTDVDHGFVTIEVRSNFNTFTIKDLLVSPAEIVWSASGEFILIHEKDFYTGAGSNGITIINLTSGKYQKISSEIMHEGTDVGLREKLNIYNLVWLDENTFAFKASVTYQGESGHPGIDQNRKSKLGEHFAKTSDSLILTPRRVEISNVSNAHNYDITKTPHHYICFKDDQSNKRIWVSYTEEGKPIAIKHNASNKPETLVFAIELFSTEGAYPNIIEYYNSFADGKFMGTLKLTHSGNWDYAEFIGENWTKKTYTIDHEANPYGSEPCF